MSITCHWHVTVSCVYVRPLGLWINAMNYYMLQCNWFHRKSSIQTSNYFKLTWTWGGDFGGVHDFVAVCCLLQCILIGSSHDIIAAWLHFWLSFALVGQWDLPTSMSDVSRILLQQLQRRVRFRIWKHLKFTAENQHTSIHWSTRNFVSVIIHCWTMPLCQIWFKRHLWRALGEYGRGETYDFLTFCIYFLWKRPKKAVGPIFPMWSRKDMEMPFEV